MATGTGPGRDRRLRQRHQPLPARLRALFPSIELAACADLDAERAAALSAKGGFPAMTVDDLLADPTIEVVLNLTPPTAHAASSRAAIAAGKHVYTEKPLATTRADAAAILDAAAAAGVRVGARPGHVPRRRPADGARALDDGRDRDAARGDRGGPQPRPGALAPRPADSSTARAAARCSTSGRTT